VYGDPGADWLLPHAATFVIPNHTVIHGGAVKSNNGCNLNCGLTIQPSIDYSALQDNSITEICATSATWPASATTPCEGSRLDGVNVIGNLYGQTRNTYSGWPLIGTTNAYGQNGSGVSNVNYTNVNVGIDKENGLTFDGSGNNLGLGGSYDDGPYEHVQVQLNATSSKDAGVWVGQQNSSAGTNTPTCPGAIPASSWNSCGTLTATKFSDILVQTGTPSTVAGTGTWTVPAAVATASDVVITPKSMVLTSAGGFTGTCAPFNTLADTTTPAHLNANYVTDCTGWPNSLTVALAPQVNIAYTETVTLTNATIATASISAANIGDIEVGTGLALGTRVLAYGGGVATISVTPTAPGTGASFTSVVQPYAAVQADNHGSGELDFEHVDSEGMRNGFVLGAATNYGGSENVHIHDSSLQGLSPAGAAEGVENAILISSANSTYTFGIGINNIQAGGAARNFLLNQYTGTVIPGTSSYTSLVRYEYDQLISGQPCESSSQPNFTTAYPCSVGVYASLPNNNVFTGTTQTFNSNVYVTGTSYFEGLFNLYNPTAATNGTNYSAPCLTWRSSAWISGAPTTVIPQICAVLTNASPPVVNLNHVCPSNAASCYESFGTGANPIPIHALGGVNVYSDATHYVSLINTNTTSDTSLDVSTIGNVATNLAGGAVGSVPYQSAASTTGFVPSPTTTGHTFLYGWQPSGSPIAPTSVDANTLTVSAAGTATTAATATSANAVNANTYPASAGLTSGGALYASGVSSVASSGLLTNHGIMLGGGAGAAPKSMAVCSSNFPVIGQSGADPICSTIAYPSSLTYGGMLYALSSTTFGSGAAPTQYGVLLGGALGSAPGWTAQGAANMPLIGQGGANPIFSTIAYPTSLTSGSILYASSTTGIATGSLITANVMVKSGGAGVAPAGSSLTDDGKNITTSEVVVAGNKVFVTGDFTDSTSGTLMAITGLSYTLPTSKAVNISFHCALLFYQATAAVSDSFGIGVTGTAPTQANAAGVVYPSATTLTPGTLVALASTTPTAVVTFTPSAITTVWNAVLDGTIEQPSNATPGVFNVYASTTTGTDNLVVKRGSYCSIW
jgi:hypothetical protein